MKDDVRTTSGGDLGPLSERPIKKWLKSPSKFNTLPFKEQLSLVLRTKGKDRQNLILSSSKSRELVQAIPEEELFFTIKEIGEVDALDLIGLTSPSQIEYIFDVEFWIKDKFRPHEALKWFGLLWRCGEEKVVKTLQHMSMDVLAIFLRKYIRVYKFEREEEIERGKKLFTLDDFYYVEFRYKDLGRHELENLIKIMRHMDVDLYMRVMESLYWGIDVESEEEAYHFRCARMADRGFPDLDEAYALYQRVEPDTYIPRMIKSESDFKVQGDRWEAIVPNHYFDFEDKRSFLSRIILAYAGEGHLNRLMGEVVSICNKALIADAVDLSDLEEVSQILKKTHGYINIGLEYLAQRDLEKGIQVIRQWYLEHVFQVGFSVLLKLSKRAYAIKMDRRLFPGDNGWCLLTSPYKEVIQGLIERYPLLYEGMFDPKRLEYRHFQNLDEVEKVENLLDKILFWAELHFSIYGFSLDDIRKLDLSGCYPSHLSEIDFTMLSLTAFANHILDGEFKFSPIKSDRLNIFLSNIFEKETPPHLQIKKSIKDNCYNWLQSILKGEAEKISYAREFWDGCFRLLDEEFGYMDLTEPVDPRFTKGLLITLD